MSLGMGDVKGPPVLPNASLFKAVVHIAFLSFARHVSKLARAFDPSISSPPQIYMGDVSQYSTAPV